MPERSRAEPRRSRTGRCRGAGFTLVEVLVATAILATALIGALTAFSMASRVAGASTNDTVLTFLAHEKLGEIQVLGREGLVAGTQRGDFGRAHPGYEWTMLVSQPDELNLVRVDVVIVAPEAGGARETEFSTLVF